VKTGEFRALAVTGVTRWRDFPAVPTVADTVIPNFEVISWTGMGAPPNLPKPIADRLNAEVRKGLAVPDVNVPHHGRGGVLHIRA
jgi:tripartite-type tricarboxylate transporter receptor subunit TctC